VETWAYIPQREFTEAVEWLTDVMRCKGQEQRVSLRVTPRTELVYDYVMTPLQFARARSQALTYEGGEFNLPLWGDFALVGTVAAGATSVAVDTRYTNYLEGGKAIVWQDEVHYEVVTVAELDDSGFTFAPALEQDYSGALVMPVVTASFLQALEVVRSRTDQVKGTARFEVVDTAVPPSISPYPTYRGYEVVTDPNVLVSDVREVLQRELTSLDSDTGVVWRGPEFSYASPTSVMSWDTLDRQALWDLKRWLHTKRGKWHGFWLPSWNNDLQITSNISPGSVQLVVRAAGYAGLEEPMDVLLLGRDGSSHYLQVTGGSAYGGWGLAYGEAYGSSSDLEVLDLSSAAGFTMASADILGCSILSFSRFDADRVEIKRRAARGASVSVPVREIPLP
jgi:hypothetical protein